MTERNDDMRDAGEARDAAFEARYRAVSNEMPSAAADAAILAQARAAARLMVEAPEQNTPQAASSSAQEVPAVPASHARGGAANDASWSRRLRAPLALAACAVLTVGIVTRIGVENPAGVTAEAPVSKPNAERIERAADTASSAPAPSTTAPAPAAAPASAPVLKPASAHADAASATANQAAPGARAKASRMEKSSDYAVASGAAPARDAPPPVEAAGKQREDERKQSAQGASALPAQAERSLSVAGVREPAVSAATESPAAPAVASAPAPAAAPPASAAPARALARSAVADRGPDVSEMRKAAAPQSAAAPAPVPAAKPAARAPQGMTPNVAQPNAPAILSAVHEAELPPERWLAYVIELRRAGLHAAADASLARLRVRYPEQGIPADARGPQAFPDSSK